MSCVAVNPIVALSEFHPIEDRIDVGVGRVSDIGLYDARPRHDGHVHRLVIGKPHTAPGVDVGYLKPGGTESVDLGQGHGVIAGVLSGHNGVHGSAGSEVFIVGQHTDVNLIVGHGAVIDKLAGHNFPAVEIDERLGLCRKKSETTPERRQNKKARAA